MRKDDPVNKTLRSLPVLTALNIALAAGLFIVGTVGSTAVAASAASLVGLAALSLAGLIVSGFAIWRLLDQKAPKLVLAAVLNVPVALLHVMALAGTLRHVFGDAA